MNLKGLFPSALTEFSQEVYYQFALYTPFYGKIPPSFLDPDGDKEFKHTAKALLGRLREAANLKPWSMVLDVGSGMGNVAFALSDYLNFNGGTYEGLEISKKKVKWCSRKYRDLRNFHFKHADIFHQHFNPEGKITGSEFRFPYPSNHFDIVILTNIFSYLMPDDVKNFVSEIARVMKKGATCLVKMFILNGDVRRIMQENKSAFHGFPTENYGVLTVLQRKGTFELFALEQSFIEELYEQVNLLIRRPLRFGSWSGRDSFYSFQDVVLAKKV